MNIVLKGYQTSAVESCLSKLDRAFADYRAHRDFTALSLSAATSAGKTIISTSLIEQLRFGTAETPENDKFTVLWLTNSPSLNRQTMAKMVATSSRIKEHHLVEIDEQVTGSTLTPGKIYFLNTQKLSKGATSYQRSDVRSVSLEQMIRNTVELLGENFLLVIDEAHVGTDTKSSGEGKIAYKVMRGVPETDEGRFPVVLGISATPDRFNNAVTGPGVNRTLMPVEVSIKDIRDSGLIKDRLLIHTADGQELSESKLMRLAVDSWKASDEGWAAYHRANPATNLVKPLLLIQVPPGVADSRLAELLVELRSLDERLTGDAVAHAFGEHKALELAGSKVHYVEPENIEKSTGIRAVLFKDALTTGWDCPRAEVMISLRAAQDQTYITQMVGRMVRTPLAQRIHGNELLNEVMLYLPLYNTDTITGVIDQLNSSGEGGIPTESLKNPVVVGAREDAGDDVWERLAQVQGHLRPAAKMPPIKNLLALGSLLAQTDLDKQAERKAVETLTDVLAGERKQNRDKVEERAASAHILDMTTQTLDVLEGTTQSVSAQTRNVDISDVAVSRIFESRARAIGGDGILKAYWEFLATGEFADDEDGDINSKLVAIAVAELPGIKAKIEAAAEARFKEWVREYESQLMNKGDIVRGRLETLKSGSPDPGMTAVSFPDAFQVSDSPHKAPAKHLYVDDNGQFPISKPMSTWETRTIESVISDPHCVGWWRNGTGGERSLGIRWGDRTPQRMMYPDFIAAYVDADGNVRLRILDPHNHSLSDTVPKWTALSEYVRAQDAIDEAYGIIVDSDDQLRAISLGSDEVHEALSQPGASIEALVEQFGFRP